MQLFEKKNPIASHPKRQPICVQENTRPRNTGSCAARRKCRSTEIHINCRSGTSVLHTTSGAGLNVDLSSGKA